MSLSEPQADSPRSQTSIAMILWWVTMAALAFATLASFPQLLGAAPSVHNVVIVALTSIVFLVHYSKKRIYSALLVQCVPVLVIGGVLLFASRGPAGGGGLLAIFLMVTIISLMLSIVLGLEFSVSRTIKNNVRQRLYLMYRAFGGAIVLGSLFGLFSGLPTGNFQIESFILGGLLGFWAGIYQAMAKTGWRKWSPIQGVPMRPIVTAGFLAAIMGPFLVGPLNRAYAVLPIIPTCLGPVLGFVASLTVLAVGWSIRSVFRKVDKQPRL